MVLDPLCKFDERVASYHGDWLRQRGWNFSQANLQGGIQGSNETECGIFLLANVEALLRLPPFFSLGDWQTSTSALRSVADCKHLREEIGAVLRQHSIRWLALGSAIQMHEDGNSAVAVTTNPAKAAQQLDDECDLIFVDHKPAPAANPKAAKAGATGNKRAAPAAHQANAAAPATVTHASKPPPMKKPQCASSSAAAPLTAAAPSSAAAPVYESEQWCDVCEAELGKGTCKSCYYIRDHPRPLPKRVRKTDPVQVRNALCYLRYYVIIYLR
jgi:hypothetical protein